MRQELKIKWRDFHPLLGASLFVLTVELLRQLAIRAPHLVELWYSQGFATLPSAILGWISQLAPFSLAEPLFLGHLLLLLILVISSLWHLLRSDVHALLEGIVRGLTYVLILYGLFMLLWGFHYLRPSLAERIEIPVKPRAVEELTTLAEALILQANQQRAEMLKDSELNLKPQAQEIDHNVQFQILAPVITTQLQRFSHTPIGQQMGLLQGAYSLPKSVLFSEGLSYLGITGIYMPFTGEANINTHAPVELLAATMLHELAHQRGIAAEDEANFVAYIVSQGSSLSAVRYSGSLLAVIHTMNALQQTAPEAANRLRRLYSEAVLLDLRAINVYWQRYEGEVSRAQERVNDAYLKHNRQESGVASYGQMVDLLLAYRAQGKK